MAGSLSALGPRPAPPLLDLTDDDGIEILKEVNGGPSNRMMQGMPGSSRGAMRGAPNPYNSQFMNPNMLNAQDPYSMMGNNTDALQKCELAVRLHNEVVSNECNIMFSSFSFLFCC